VTLTPEGELFFEEAKAILSRTETAVERVLRLSRGQAGKITIGLCGPVTAPILPKIIRSFRRQHSDVVVEVRERAPVEQIHALLESEIDIGFTRSVPADAKNLVSSELLLREPVIVALPKEHPLSKEHTVAIGKIAQETFVLYSREGAPTVFDTIVAMCRKAKFSPKIAATSRSWQSVLTMVESGQGIALLPACTEHLRADDVVFLPLEDHKIRLDAYVIWRRSDSNILVQQFLSLLRDREQPVSSKSRQAYQRGA
jgi:DNA-binding transcriptional LysR family regulator